MIIAMLGLGEAGSTLARDLITAGAAVRSWDPLPKAIPDGVIFTHNNREAVEGSDVVISVNWASVSVEVAQEVADSLQSHQIYVDINTASPQKKGQVAQAIEAAGIRFVDAALMGPVPIKGIGTAVYASGTGAEVFHERLTPFGMPITILDDRPGSAATHKLIRSIMYKGVAAVVMECLEAAQALDMEDYAREQIMTILNNESMIDRFVKGSHKHATRRMQEMEAVVEMLDGLDLDAFTSQAAVQKLQSLTKK